MNSLIQQHRSASSRHRSFLNITASQQLRMQSPLTYTENSQINQKDLIHKLVQTLRLQPTKKNKENKNRQQKARSQLNSGQKQRVLEDRLQKLDTANSPTLGSQNRRHFNLTLPHITQAKYKSFKMLQFLGKGRYSNVHLAIDENTNYHVALKIMKKAQIQSMSQSIAQEIKIQYLLNHPNIVKLYTFFQNTDEIVLVLEYCPNGQIHKILKGLPECCFPEKLASSYIRQILSALIYLHRNGIIHRDLKPENIFLCYNQIKIADFTYSVYSPEDQRQTQCGSLAYLSPEIIRGENYDKSTDMWSLGVLAYELCCGETPWEDLRQDEMQQMIQDGIIKMPDSFSCELKDFISKLVTSDSKSRMTAKQAMTHPWVQQQEEQLTQYEFNL
ncbi:unnamed protein product (macronuclear) [Paramecium tetraurelia]|uniref:Aurora kinase n=1 Tax=Paramecium tetraurelia TaxID=5888 RepID=A0EIQ0_PARTE|nr:uncharacterized protein GSPATT00027520001 [Paramecium tetraurelia]CAK95191.1 unnamed protein product [Paramecium tetraurelia]|eukprot:XP_001462564.1 hypothetical protein (macronuclear) [Paramecium tetraurelia strain d4-2]